MITIDLEVEDEAWRLSLPNVESLAQTAARAALAEAGREANLVILLTGDDEVRDLNLRFRAQDKATNVLSFPAPENREGHLGDLALAHGVCLREALAQDKPLAHHLQHLVMHGVLHLIGYDHETDAEALIMEDLERAALAGLGIGDPYAEAPEAAERGDDGKS